MAHRDRTQNDGGRTPAVAKSGVAKAVGLGLLGTAVALGGMALLVRQRARHAEAEHPPIGQFVDADGVRLHYLDQGRGRPVVLLHGVGAQIEDFTLSIFDRLTDHYRVLAFDRPGYGYSERPQGVTWTPERQAMLLHTALARLNVQRPILLGHSWGCSVALTYALRYPQNVTGLVLLAGYYYPTERLDFPLYAAPAMPGVGRVMAHTVSPLVGAMMAPAQLRRMFAPNPVPQRFLRDFPVEMPLRPSQLRAAAEEVALLRTWAAQTSPRYGDITMPVVLVTGGDDHMVNPHNHSWRLHRDIPRSSIRTLGGTGHMLHHIHPQAVVEAVDLVAQQDLAAGPSAHERLNVVWGRA